MIDVTTYDSDSIVRVDISGRVTAAEYSQAAAKMKTAIDDGYDLWLFSASAMKVPTLEAFVMDMRFTMANRSAFRRSVFMTDSNLFAVFTAALSRVMPVRHYRFAELAAAESWLLAH